MASKVKIESTLENKKKQKTSIFNSSSAVFFVIHNPENNIFTEISFLNHFLLKRNIKNVIATIKLRSLDGKLFDEYSIKVKEPTTYTFNPCKNIENIFIGSAYVSFKSDENLAVPFCAVVSSISTKNSVCSIHTYGRRLEEKEIGTKIDIPRTKETGWTLRDNLNTKSFAIFHNGKYDSQLVFILEVTNHKGETFHETFSKLTKAYETVILFPQEMLSNLIEKLDNQYGHGKISITGLKGVFPRMMCGNFIISETDQKHINTAQEIQFTHTNFDFGELIQPDSNGSIGYFNHPHLPDGIGLFYPVETSKNIFVKDKRYTSKSFHKFNIDSFQQIKVTAKNDKLPSRFVGASIGRWPQSELESECSTGITIEEYVTLPCHWHWGQVKPGFGIGESIISVFVHSFGKIHDTERIINLRFFDQNGLLNEREIKVEESLLIKPSDFISMDKSDGAVWYVLSGERLEEMTIFSTFIPENKAGSCEHAF